MVRIVELSDYKHAFARFRRHGMTDHAASLTYYGLLSLFPTLLFGVAVLGLVGQEDLADRTADYLLDHGAPKETVDAVSSAVDTAVSSAGGTKLSALVIGLVTALYGASGAFGAFGRALNVAFGVEEGRGFVRRKLTDIGFTLTVIALALVTLVLVFLGGGLSEDVFDEIGLGRSFASVWAIARWPAALASAMLIYAVIYHGAPNARPERVRWISPGAVSGVLLWILATVGFFVYVANFSSYNATYGAFAGAVILLVWLWLTNVALLFGAELNAQIELRRSPEELPEDYDGPTVPEKVPPDGDDSDAEERDRPSGNGAEAADAGARASAEQPSVTDAGAGAPDEPRRAGRRS